MIHPVRTAPASPPPGAAVMACARAAHEANRAYCIALGDGSQFPWDTAPPHVRDSCLKGVQRVLEGATPEALHESWVAEKRAAGWTYGDVKDGIHHTHPCIKPYNELPRDQQAKDHIYLSVVTAMAKALGLMPVTNG